jgi:hypothetical protein
MTGPEAKRLSTEVLELRRRVAQRMSGLEDL